jgi:hypothetical protein
MIALISPTGQSLDLFPDTVVGMELKNPIFDSEFLNGGFSYAFTIPQTEANILFFDFKNKVAANQDFERFYYGFTLKSGITQIAVTVRLRSMVDDKININLFTDSGAVASLMKNTKLKDVPMDEILLPVTFGMFIHAYMGLIAGGPEEGDLIGTSLKYTTIPGFPTNEINFAVKFRTDGPTTIQDLCNKINNPVHPEEFILSKAYLKDDVVVSSDGVYWMANVDTQNADLIDEEDGGNWIFIGDRVIWHFYYGNNYIAKERYSDPYDDGRLLATPTEGQIPFTNSFIVRDIRVSTPDLMILTNSFSNYGEYYGFDVYASNVNPVNFYTDYHAMLNTDMKARNNIAPTSDQASHVFPCIRNIDFTTESEFAGYLNYFDGGNFSFNSNAVGSRFKFAISPQVYVSYVFKKICEFIGFEYNKEFFTQNLDHASKLLYSNRTLSQISAFYTNVYVYLDAFTNNYRLQDVMPEGTISNFINAIRSYFFWGVFFDIRSSKIRLVTYNDIMDSVPLDWTSLVSPVDEISFENKSGFVAFYREDGSDLYKKEFIEPDLMEPNKYRFGEKIYFKQYLPNYVENVDLVRYVVDEDSFYQYQQNPGGSTSWNFISKNVVGVLKGQGENRHQTMADTLLMGTIAKKVGVTWRVPVTRREAYSLYNFRSTRVPMRFLNYLGLQPDSSDNTYPMASSDNINFDGDEIAGIGHTRFENEKGLVETDGKKWFEFLTNTQDVKFTIQFDEISFNQIDFARRIKIGNNLYLLKSVNFAIPLDSKLATIVVCPIRILN